MTDISFTFYYLVSEMTGLIPRQQRAIQTRRRVYEAALEEFERVGVEAARVEDIVAAAGVGWGTFFRYFPRKEDVLLEAVAVMAEAFAQAVHDGLDGGGPVVRTTAEALASASRAALSERPALRLAMLREQIANPERLAAYLAQRTQPSMTETMTELLEEGQRRGEVRDDYPARALAQITMSAIAAAHRQEIMSGRPPGAWRGWSQHHVVLALETVAYGFVPRVNGDSDAPTAAEVEG